MALNLLPNELVSQLRRLTSVETDPQWAGTQLLLIDVGEGTSELLQSLVATSTHGGAPLVATRDGISFMTTVTQLPTGVSTPAQSTEYFNAEALMKQLTRSAYFIAPLRKRETTGMGWAERINVGRARNNDVVLRHETVSKFHAWFESDDDGKLWLTDAGSTNRTRVNGQVLQHNVAIKLTPGAEIEFGTVRAVFCSPGLVWRVVAQHLRQ